MDFLTQKNAKGFTDLGVSSLDKSSTKCGKTWIVLRKHGECSFLQKKCGTFLNLCFEIPTENSKVRETFRETFPEFGETFIETFFMFWGLPS